jgi:hypothetical protein
MLSVLMNRLMNVLMSEERVYTDLTKRLRIRREVARKRSFVAEFQCHGEVTHYETPMEEEILEAKKGRVLYVSSF